MTKFLGEDAAAVTDENDSCRQRAAVYDRAGSPWHLTLMAPGLDHRHFTFTATLLAYEH